MSQYHEHRRHPYSAAALNAPPTTKKRPSLASPLPPSPIVPSTPLPKSKNQPAYQHRPSTATSTSSANLSDSPSTCTRGMMKRLLAKPAPPSVALVPPSSPSMRSDPPKFNREDQEPAPEIIISSLPPRIDSLPANDFDKSIRALDLVGQIEISMTPTETYTARESAEISRNLEPIADDSAKRHRHLRRRPSGTTKVTTIYLPSSSSEPSYDGSTTPTPSTLTPLRPLPIRFPPQTSSSSPTRHPTQRNTSFDGSNPINSSDIQIPNRNPPESVTPYYTVDGDTSAAIAPSGSLGDSFWDTDGEYCDKQQNEDGTGGFTRGLTRTISGKRKKHDTVHQPPSKASLHELNKASIDRDHGIVKTSPSSNQNRRLWKLMKKISVSALREKTQLNPGHPPPVPPLPSDINAPFRRTRHTSHPSDPSLLQTRAEDRGITQLISASSTPVLELSPTTPLGKVNTIDVSPSTSVQPELPSTPQSTSTQPATGPPPSTTPRSSSPSSDVASSHSYPFNRQSPRSSTSSFFEEMTALPPLPTTLTPTNDKTNTNDTSAGRKLQQHIIPPNELSRHHSIPKFPTNTCIINPVSVQPRSPPMEDDWTIVRSPSVELEALPLPPPPRQVSKGVGTDRRKGAGGDQGYKQSRTKAKANLVLPTSKTVNPSSEEMDKKSRDAASNAPSDGRTEKPSTMEETDKLQQGGKELETERSNADPDSDQSPTIPSFSTTSAINSFPARRLSSTLSATSRSRGSPIALSPARSSRSSGASSTVCRMGSSSPLPPRTPERHESRSTFGRVRQHLFGTNGDRSKIAENNGQLPRKSEVQMAHLRQLYSPLHPPPEYRTKSRRHHRHSSGSTTSISSPKATHTSAVSVSMPSSPIAPQPHRRSMSFHTSLPSLGFTSAGCPSESLPPPPASRSLGPISSTSLAVSTTKLTPPLSLVRSRTPSRSGISGKKLSEVLFSSSGSPVSPGPSFASASRGRSSSASGHRTIGFMSRSITVGVNNHSNSNNPMNSPSRSQLTDQEKADKWNDLLARSARAGGTLHLAVGGGLLASDDI